MRTVVNVKAGGRTPISGMLHAVILLVIILGAASLASDIPKAVLAGILIKVGTDIIDWDYLKRIWVVPKAGVIIMLTVLVITVTIDLMLAVGVGMIMASFLFMNRMTELQIRSMKVITEPSPKSCLSSEEDNIMGKAGGKIMLFHLCGPLSFTSAKAMVRQHASAHDYKVMLLDMTDVTLIDYTTSRAINDIIIDTKQVGCDVLLVGVTETVRNTLDPQGIMDHFTEAQIYEGRLEALQSAEELLSL